jgi:hypothetical protein
VTRVTVWLRGGAWTAWPSHTLLALVLFIQKEAKLPLQQVELESQLYHASLSTADWSHTKAS